MKWVRFGLVPLLLLAFATAALAEEKAAEGAKAAAKPTATAKSPEEMAKTALAKWKGVLKLTPEQQPQFESVMTDSYRKMAEAKTAAAGDKAKLKESTKTIMSDRDTELTKILTPDQMKIYHEKMEKGSAKAKEHMEKSEGATKEKAEGAGK